MNSHASDKIIIKDLRFSCRVGCSESERETPQLVVLDVTLFFDITKPAASEKLEDTICYIEVFDLIKKTLEMRTYTLVETAVEVVAKEILMQFPVRQVTLLMKKPRPLQKRGGAWVGIEITRS